MTPSIHTVTLPDIGEGVVEGEVIEWLKNVNDTVKQDEPVVIVMTDKATVELPAPYPGKLVKQYHKPGDIAHKGKPLYDLEVTQEIQTHQAEQPTTVATFKDTPKAKETPQARPATGKALCTPPIRHLAKELGIDLSEISGTGKQGRITLQDLQKQVAGLTPSSQAASLKPLEGDEVSPLIGIRKLTAQHMTESKANIPHFSYFDHADATRLMQLKENLKKQAADESIPLTYMPLFIRALSLAIKKYPQVNASVDMHKESLIIHHQHNVGIAISTRMGLIVPVLKHVDSMSLSDIVRKFHQIKVRALTSKLESQDMQDSTITISNFGTLGNGGLFATPIINFPEVAILAVAKIQKQPIAKNNEVISRDVLNLSWSFDHRVIDGDTAAAFSHEFVSLIQNPSQLL